MEMNEREQHAVEVLDEVLDAWKDKAGTHSRDCYKRHPKCLAFLIKDILTDEENYS